MGRGKLRFREADVTRAVRAARKAGINVTRVRIETDDAIVIEAGSPSPQDEAAAAFDEWQTGRRNDWDDIHDDNNGAVSPYDQRLLSVGVVERLNLSNDEFLAIWNRASRRAREEWGRRWVHECQGASEERRNRKEGLRAAGFNTLVELFAALGKTAEVRAYRLCLRMVVRTGGLEPPPPHGEQIFVPLRLSPPP